jgi:hypothetical protein
MLDLSSGLGALQVIILRSADLQLLTCAQHTNAGSHVPLHNTVGKGSYQSTGSVCANP